MKGKERKRSKEPSKAPAKEIGIVAFPDDVIGFGLAGVKNMFEVNEQANKEDLLAVLEQAKDLEILFISEKLLNQVRTHSLLQGKFVVEIPQAAGEFNAEHIDKLVRDTLGIKMKN